MNVGKINKKVHKKKILLAPLDWGLGHATRCVPLIKLLISSGAEVIIAAEGPVASLLKKEFPACVILRLKGYKIRYSSSKTFFFLKMFTQFPKVISVMKYEKEWLNHIIADHEIDGVISDNRFGFYTNKIPCVFITHQLFIQTGNKVLDKLAQKINYKYINKFDDCWVADGAGTNNLAGALSHPGKLPATPVKYLGILSRCEKLQVEKNIDLLLMISGPEPQRSIFEKVLLPQLEQIKGSVVFLRGMPLAKDELLTVNKNVTIYNHVPAASLNKMIQESKLVVARCGYSTIMDLAVLNQRAILIPTPGQTEQEYLAGYLKEKNLFYTVKQEGFCLEKEIENVNKFEFAATGSIPRLNERIVIDWLRNLNTAEQES
ncbi:MAG: glycosyltransferase [Ferruginibacter sp.]